MNTTTSNCFFESTRCTFELTFVIPTKKNSHQTEQNAPTMLARLKNPFSNTQTYRDSLQNRIKLNAKTLLDEI
ncbi:hypothetical protein [Synechococcus sp. MIT S1220]|uniref:hypothetical protein n=1 Tax=Synechococcus sp. MIT S1220 TaxID=3082549 RepID=UPI0039B02A5D